MNIEMLKDFFLWGAVINYGLLLWWFLLFVLAHDIAYRFTARWFRLSVGQFDLTNWAGIAFYKLSIILFYLTPYIALRIVG